MISPDQQDFTVPNYAAIRKTTKNKCNNALSEPLSDFDYGIAEVVTTVRLHVSSENNGAGLKCIRGLGKEPIGKSVRVLVFYAATGRAVPEDLWSPLVCE